MVKEAWIKLKYFHRIFTDVYRVCCFASIFNWCLSEYSYEIEYEGSMVFNAIDVGVSYW
jgi:hypothetical protein